jgi:hypothetical protein
VGLLFSMPGLKPGVVDAPVKTRQVAPAIIQLLDLDPQLLQAVQLEHTKVLPGLELASDD